jgi:hypothetical protein
VQVFLSCGRAVGKAAERQVDGPVGGARRGPQAGGIVQGTAVDLRSGGGERGGRGIRTGQPGDLVTGGQEFGNDGGADKAGRASDEYAHERTFY